MRPVISTLANGSSLTLGKMKIKLGNMTKSNLDIIRALLVLLLVVVVHVKVLGHLLYLDLLAGGDRKALAHLPEVFLLVIFYWPFSSLASFLLASFSLSIFIIGQFVIGQHFIGALFSW